MTKYNVHIYREMRLAFRGIQAESLEAAAAIAREKPTEDADSIDDCEGETIAALVDVQGDEEFEQSRTIDFECERLRRQAPAMLKALQMASNYMSDDRDENDETEMTVFNAIRAAIAEAETAALPCSDPTARPIVTVTVRSGLIDDIDATIPLHAVVEDWDVADDDTGKKPFRNVWTLAGGLSDTEAVKLRRLIANS